MDEEEITTIRVHKATRDRLASLCNKDETFDQAINKLIDVFEKKKVD